MLMAPLTPRRGLPWTGSSSCDYIEYRQRSTRTTFIFRKVRRKSSFAQVGIVQLFICSQIALGDIFLGLRVRIRREGWEGHWCLSLVSVVFRQVEVSETSW